MDDNLLIAIGEALAVVGGLMERSKIAKMEEFSNMLAMLGTIDRDTRPIASEYLCLWPASSPQVLQPQAGLTAVIELLERPRRS